MIAGFTIAQVVIMYLIPVAIIGFALTLGEINDHDKTV
jgi:mannose/fructose/N-acetylgalactosamine-specific phosphotransferase system component IIC